MTTDFAVYTYFVIPAKAGIHIILAAEDTEKDRLD